MNFYERYWTEFNKHFNAKVDLCGDDFPLKPKKVSHNNYMTWSCFGRKGLALQVSLRSDSDWIAVNFTINLKDEKEEFKKIEAKKNEIEKNYGEKLRWKPLPHEKSNTQVVLTKHGVDVTNSADWPVQQKWLIDNLSKFYNSFNPVIRKL